MKSGTSLDDTPGMNTADTPSRTPARVPNGIITADTPSRTPGSVPNGMITATSAACPTVLMPLAVARD